MKDKNLEMRNAERKQKMEKETLFIAKIEDKLKKYQKTHEIQTTYFLDPAEVVRIKRMVRIVPYCFYGGRSLAERVILMIGTEDKMDAQKELAMVTIEANEPLKHREVLGSVLGLGVKREMVGDIVINESRADILVRKEIVFYVLQNLNQIGRQKVQVYQNDLENIVEEEDNEKEICITVPSLRMDAIISGGIGCSRETSAQLIKTQKVKCNHVLATNQSKAMQEGDVLSVRGYGRLIVANILGTTQKGRIKIRLKKKGV